MAVYYREQEEQYIVDIYLLGNKGRISVYYRRCHKDDIDQRTVKENLKPEHNNTLYAESVFFSKQSAYYDIYIHTAQTCGFKYPRY